MVGHVLVTVDSLLIWTLISSHGSFFFSFMLYQGTRLTWGMCVVADGGIMGDFHPSLSTITSNVPISHWLPFPTGCSHNIAWPFSPSKPIFFSTLVFWDPSAIGNPSPLPSPRKTLNIPLLKVHSSFSLHFDSLHGLQTLINAFLSHLTTSGDLMEIF